MKKDKKEMSIDDLATMVASGFSEVTSTMATKDELKDGLKSVRNELKDELKDVVKKDDLEESMNRHIGTFRKDYDELASRVKKLEDRVFANR